MHIVKYDKDYKGVWDNFVNYSRNGTVFHKQGFLEYHGDRFEDHSLMFFDKKNNLIAVFPAGKQNRDDEIILRSHPGSSYGGVVMDNSLGVSNTKEIVDAIECYGNTNGFNSIELRTSPRVFHKYPSEEIDYILWYNGFEIAHIELSDAVMLYPKTEVEVLGMFKDDTSRSISKARKAGVVVTLSNSFEDYWRILTKNLSLRHRANPTHTLEEIKKIDCILPGAIRLYCAYYNDEVIAGTLVFCCNSNAYHTFYIAQDYEYQNLRPLNVLFHDVLLYLREEGIKYLNFGISTEYGGTAMNEGLFRFKEGFGARGVVRRYYRKEL